MMELVKVYKQMPVDEQFLRQRLVMIEDHLEKFTKKIYHVYFKAYMKREENLNANMHIKFPQEYKHSGKIIIR